MAATLPVCNFGLRAVAATHPGIDGKLYSLLGADGSNGLVVAFICNHRPRVKALIGRIVRDASDDGQFDVGIFTIKWKFGA